MNRRALLAGACSWVAVAGPAEGVVRAPAPEARRLKLFNAHTGAKFDGSYRNADGPIASATAELSQFLYDFHSGTAVTMDIAVIDFLWDVLNAVGATSATILSAYRTPETNAMLARTTFGVAEHSQHIYARAIDFTIGSGLDKAMTAARAMARGGVGWYPQSHFIHVDSGPVRNWTLGGGGLQHLLNDPGGLRDARNAPGAPAVPRSQYRAAASHDDVIRPSQFTASGAREGSIRPSQYGGGS